MKRITLLMVVLLTTFILFAKPRSEQASLKIATDFLVQIAQKSDMQKAKFNPSSLDLVYSKEISMHQKAYFVYGNKAGAGFVIVSADDRMHEVLGYSTTTTFDEQDIPDNMKFWLKAYELELMQLEASETDQDSGFSVQKAQTNNFAPSINPLLGGIKWNQGAPYNNLCPSIGAGKRAASGCVATAMAQLMKYYEWPAVASGSKSYSTRTLKINLSESFEGVQYDWSNMTPTYNSSRSEVENSAVAKLMYHCGIAVEMDYNDSSGAYTEDIAQAMIDYFGYDDKMQLYKRNFYTRAEWVDLIKAELNASRPVLYGGVSDDGGHQFILDGYDVNDFFHVNWGWGGMSDGYFRVSALDPDSHGIGGGLGGFNYSQSIYTGIQKPTANSSMVSQVYMTTAMTYPKDQINRTTSMAFTLNSMFNYGVNTMTNVQIGLAFYNSNGEEMLVKPIVSTSKLEPLKGLF